MPGDNLTIYAGTGAIFYLYRDWPVRRLVRVGSELLVLQALIGPPLLLATPDTPPDLFASERAILTDGGFLDAAEFRSIGFAVIMPTSLSSKAPPRLAGSASGWRL